MANNDDFAPAAGILAGERRKQTKLVNNPETQELYAYLQAVKNAIAQPMEARVTKKMVPRYGGLSLFAASTGFFVYDNEMLCEQLPTAFACGKYVFFSAPFLRELRKQGDDSVIFVALHELLHINLLHGYRLQGINPTLRNIAMDFIINTRLRISYEDSSEAKNYRNQLSNGSAPELITSFNAGEEVRKGCGFEAGDLEKYGRLSEEEAVKLLADEMKNQQQNQQQGSGNPSQGGQSGGQGQSSQGGSGQQGGGSASSGTSDWSDGDGGQSDRVITEDELREIFDKAGLKAGDGEKISDKLDLAETREESDQKSEQRAIDIANKVGEAKRQYRDAGIKLPGGHIDDFISEVIGDLGRPQMSFKVGLKHMASASGKKSAYIEDVPAPVYFTDPSDMNMTDAVYLGSSVPQKRSGDVLVLVDTSGSMGTEELRESLREIISIVRAERDDVRVILKWADTAIRGTEILREGQFESRKEWGVAGRGGTDFKACINEAMRDPIVMQSSKSGRLAGLVYFSDLGDTPPARADLPHRLPPMAYVATQNAYAISDFRRKVDDYAQVLQIEEGAKLDMEKKPVSLGM